MDSLKRTARITGLLYLALAITGMVAYLVLRSKIYVADDAEATTANLIEFESFARWRIAFDFALVISQSLAALWFFKLYRGVNSFAAACLTAFGLVNAAIILVATAFTITAINVATGELGASGIDQASTVQLLYNLNDAAWGGGNLFFGLWLIPMGYLAIKSGFMPRILGQILVIGGFGYIASAFVYYLAPDAPAAVSSVLTGVATIGEFWAIGYLIIKGVRTPRGAS